MDVGAASNDEDDNLRRTGSGYCERVAPDRGNMKVCPDVDAEVGEEQLTNAIEGEIKFGKTQACK